MSGRISPVSCLGAGLVSLTFGAPGWAQTLAAAAPAADQNEGPALEEIVVTAQKRTERLLDVPMTVDALQGDQLRQLAIYDFQNISQLSPGLVISNESGRNGTIQVRGISFQQYSGASPGVTVYWNEVLVGATTALRPMFDIGQVEVLRGAQGTLRGDTSPAGQITITTRRPSRDEFEVDAQQTFGNLSTVNTQGGISIPIVKEVLALRVAGLYDRNDEDGAVNITNGRHNSTQTQAGRATLEFKPTDDFAATLIYQKENSTNVTYPTAAGLGNAALFPLTPDGPALTPQDNASVTPGPMDFYHKEEETALLARWDLGGYRLNYVGSYQDVSDPSSISFDTNNAIPNPPASAFTGTYPGLGQNLSQSSSRTYTHELRFESTRGDFWNFLFGAYYSHSQLNVEVFQGSDSADTTTTPGAVLDRPGPAATQVVVPEKLATEALFTDQRFQVTEADQVDVGFRYTRDPQERQSTLFIGLTPAGVGVPAAFLPAVCGLVPGGTYANGLCNLPPQQTIPASASSVTWTGRSGSLNYSHHFDADKMAYLSYARSYRAGGPDVGATATLPIQYLTFQQETSDSFELGFKGNLFNNRLQLIADVFHQKYNNFIGTAQNLIYTATPNPAGTPTCPTGTGSSCNVSITTNGPAESTGVELTLRTKFTEHLYTQLNVAYADAHYVNASLPCNDYNNTGVPNASGTPRVQPNKFVSTCASNDPLSPTVGRWQLSANGEYSYGVTGSIEAYLRGLLNFSSRAPGTPGTALPIPSTTFVNAFLGLRSVGKVHGWDGFLYARNLFDARNFVVSTNQQIVLGVPTGYQNYFSQPQRQYGITVSYHY